MVEWVDIDLVELSPLRPPGSVPQPAAVEIEAAGRIGLENWPAVVVRPKNNTNRYELVQGVRVWVLAQRAGYRQVPVSVAPDLTDNEVRELVSLDFGTEPDNPLARARVLENIVKTEGLNITEAGRRLGLRREAASHHLRILRLPNEILDLVRDGDLGLRHARALLAIQASNTKKISLAHQAARGKMTALSLERLAAGSSETGATRHTTPGKGTAKDLNVVRLEGELSEVLGCPVLIDETEKGRGELRISWHNYEILDGVLDRIRR